MCSRGRAPAGTLDLLILRPCRSAPSMARVLRISTSPATLAVKQGALYPPCIGSGIRAAPRRVGHLRQPQGEVLQPHCRAKAPEGRNERWSRASLAVDMALRRSVILWSASARSGTASSIAPRWKPQPTAAVPHRTPRRGSDRAAWLAGRRTAVARSVRIDGEIREEARRGLGLRLVDEWRTDLRYALRTFARQRVHGDRDRDARAASARTRRLQRRRCAAASHAAGGSPGRLVVFTLHAPDAMVARYSDATGRDRMTRSPPFPRSSRRCRTRRHAGRRHRLSPTGANVVADRRTDTTSASSSGGAAGLGVQAALGRTLSTAEIARTRSRWR